MTEERFHHDGLSLAVWSVGEGRPMLFQHGLCGDAAQTAEVFPLDVGWRGVTLECRGHGASDPGPQGALSFATFARDLAALIEERLGPPMPVGGISLGAALALRLAVIRPDLVSALVLARPAWAGEAAPPNLAPYALAGDLLARHPPAAARAAFDASPTAARLAAEAPDNLASLRTILSREPVAVTCALLTRIAADGPGVTPMDLARLGRPTLVIGHGRDLAHPFALAEELAAAIPGARLAVITPKSESRDRYRVEFRAALAAFLQDLP